MEEFFFFLDAIADDEVVIVSGPFCADLAQVWCNGICTAEVWNLTPQHQEVFTPGADQQEIGCNN